MSKPSNATWVEVNLTAIQNNIKFIEQFTGSTVMAVVKANAYGHGIVEVAKALQSSGTSWLGVARIDEAIQLRDNGVQNEIMVLGHTAANDIHFAADNNIVLAMHSLDQVSSYKNAAQILNKKIRIHIKIDTGMGRLGVFPEDGYKFLKLLETIPNLIIEGIFTHLARADELNSDSTKNQIRKFEDLLKLFNESGIEFKWIHAANSAGSMFQPSVIYNLVRPGISIYGLNPSINTPLPDQFVPSLSWKTVLTSVKNMPQSSGISYGHKYITSQNELVGTISVGYGDGYRRVPGNEVLIRGIRVPVIGVVCMDQCVVSLENVPDAQAGDEVVLIGKQNGEEISAEDLACNWETIVYEPICGLTNRIPRIYFNQSGAS